MQLYISDWCKYIHQWAIDKGFWELNKRNIPEQLCLMHSELSKALEEYRNDGNVGTYFKGIGYLHPDEYFDFAEKGNKPEGFGIELADCMIRIMDTAGAYGINLEYLIAVKMAYNKTRPHKHGRVC